MRLHPLRAGTVLAVSALAVLGPIVPASAQVCDAYSGTCATPPTSVLPETLTRGSAQVHPGVQANSGTAPTTLPFTGGQLVLLSTAGAGALAAGTVMVMAGRRRKVVPGT